MVITDYHLIYLLELDTIWGLPYDRGGSRNVALTRTHWSSVRTGAKCGVKAYVTPGQSEPERVTCRFTVMLMH